MLRDFSREVKQLQQLQEAAPERNVLRGVEPLTFGSLGEKGPCFSNVKKLYQRCFYIVGVLQI